MKRPSKRNLPEWPKEETIWRHMLTGGAGVIFLAFLSYQASIHHLMTGWENIGLDSILKMEHYRDPNILLIKITDDDYKNYFNQTSPLDPKKIQCLILQAARIGPDIIAVDLDLAESKLGNKKLLDAVHDEIEKNFKNPKTPKVIWPYPLELSHGSSPIIEIEAKDKAEAEDLERWSDRLAVPLFPRDSGGTVRRIHSEITLKLDGICHRWPTMPQAVELLHKGDVTLKPDKTAPCDEESAETWSDKHTYLLGFSGEPAPFDEMDADTLYKMEGDQFSKTAARWSGKPESLPKVVFIGGTYAAARDLYWTPAGEKYGVDLMAVALHSLQNSPSTPLQEKYGMGLDISLGLAILLIGFFFRHSVLWGITYSLGTAVFVPLILSHLVFRSWNHWVAFMPGIIASFIHLFYDSVQELRHSKKEIQSLEEENRILRRQKTRLKKRLATPAVTVVSEQIVIAAEKDLTKPPAQVRAAGAGEAGS